MPNIMTWQHPLGQNKKNYSKTCLMRSLKKTKKIFMSSGRLMKVESIAECSPWLRPALSDNRSWKPILAFFLSGRLRQILLYCAPSED